MKKMCEPTFEEKSYGQGGGIPVLKTIWELFDLSLLFSQLGFQKHSGLAAWQLAFAYICGLIHNKAKKNTILFRKIYDPALGRETYAKINPKHLLREVYPKLHVTGNSATISLPDIFIKLPYESLTRKGKPITKQRMVPIAAVAGTYTPPDDSNGLLFERETAATFKNIYLLISNRFDLPEKVAEIYVKHWKIEVFYRTLKQDLGLTSCYARSENAHFAHVELLFTAKSLLDYAAWLNNS